MHALRRLGAGGARREPLPRRGAPATRCASRRQLAARRETLDSVDRRLRDLGPGSPDRRLHARLPERLARAPCATRQASIRARRVTRSHARAPAGARPRPGRDASSRSAGDRGFTHAEVTAGGVPLSRARLATMESRRCPRAPPVRRDLRRGRPHRRLQLPVGLGERVRRRRQRRRNEGAGSQSGVIKPTDGSAVSTRARCLSQPVRPAAQGMAHGGAHR